ncbi:SLC13 family permease (plasmid) [Pseudoalteromonas espejiana]
MRTHQIFLFLGGFLISIAMERWGLHKRIALKTMLLAGTKPSYQILAMMLVTAFLSMWMSNTATAVMMLPIALSVTHLVKQTNPKNTGFGTAILLAIAYGASVGGIATLIGTPPNALMAAYLSDTYNIEIGFAKWMLVGVPLSLSMLIVIWVWLTKFAYHVDSDSSASELDTKMLFKQQLNQLGKNTQRRKTCCAYLRSLHFGWMFRPIIAEAINYNFPIRE